MSFPIFRIRGRAFLIVAMAIVGLISVATAGLTTLYDNLLQDRRDKTESA